MSCQRNPILGQRFDFRRRDRIMRHGWTVFRTLIILGLSVSGVARCACGGEPTDDRLGMRTVPILLVCRPDVQKDLGINPKQAELCKTAARVFYERAFKLRGRNDAGARAARRQIDLDTTNWLGSFLTPQQLDRLEQIDLQWEGASAMYSRPMLDESLQLTPAQQQQVKQSIAQGNAQRAQAGWSYEDHVNQTRIAISFLDARQKELWIHAIGPKCPFHIELETKTAQSQPPVRK
jgi:hypothetical protein